jgi:hypothetical protein
MSKVYVYVVARDFGFAPNPFHGICTLATCKPTIRRVAVLGDWVIGMGGSKLKATGRCIFAMQVTRSMTFSEYWANPDFKRKRPSRNGSRKAMVGDNIYHQEGYPCTWRQADSHHSRPDGSADPYNMSHDTSTDRVLLSDRFIYFGENAPRVPPAILTAIGYRNQRSHRTYDEPTCRPVL